MASCSKFTITNWIFGARWWVLDKLFVIFGDFTIPFCTQTYRKWPGYIRGQYNYSSSPVCCLVSCKVHHSEASLPHPHAKNYIQVSHFSLNIGISKDEHVKSRFGPIVHQWTMRYEAKHKYFKDLANVTGNFINLPHTLATRHQHLQCYLHLNRQSNVPEFSKGNYSYLQLPIDLITAIS